MASNVRVGLIVSASLRGFQTFRNAQSTFEGLRNVAVRLRAELALLGGYFAFAFVRETIRVFAEFDHSMARVAAVAGATAQELNSLTNEALRLGREFPFTASEAADAMFELAIAGLQVEEVMAAVQATLELAMAGNMGLAESSAIAVATMNAFGMEATDVREIGDQLSAAFTGSATTLDRLGAGLSFVGPVASLANVSLADTVTTLGLFANAGISGARSGTTFRQMLSRMLDPTAEAQTKMNELGLSFTDAEGNLLPLIDVIDQLIKKQVTANDVIAIFGVRAAPGIGALITQGTEGFAELNNEIINSEGKLNEIATTMEGSALMALKKFESSVQDLQVELGKMLMPAIIAATEAFREKGGIKDALIDTAVALSDLGSVIVEVVAALEPLFQILFHLAKVMADNKEVVTGLILGLLYYKAVLLAVTLGIKIKLGLLAMYKSALVVATAAQASYAAGTLFTAATVRTLAAAIWAATWPLLAFVGIVGGIILLYTKWETISVQISIIYTDLKIKFDNVVTSIGNLFSLMGMMASVAANFLNPVNLIRLAVQGLISVIGKAIQMYAALINLKNDVVGGIGNFFEPVTGAIGGIMGSYNDGGMVPQTGLYMLHAGETVKRAQAQESTTMAEPASTPASQLVVNVEGYLEGREIELVDSLTQFMKGRSTGVI